MWWMFVTVLCVSCFSLRMLRQTFQLLSYLCCPSALTHFGTNYTHPGEQTDTQTERPTHTVITHPHFLVLVILLLSSRAVLLNSHLLPIRINFNSVNINLPRLKYCLWQLVHGSKIFFPPFPSGVKGWLLKSTTSIFIKSQTPTLSCICSNLRLKQRSVKRTNVFVIYSATAISKIPLL